MKVKRKDKNILIEMTESEASILKSMVWYGSSWNDSDVGLGRYSEKSKLGV
jgi:hypothetical protein